MLRNQHKIIPSGNRSCDVSECRYSCKLKFKSYLPETSTVFSYTSGTNSNITQSQITFSVIIYKMVATPDCFKSD